MHVLRDRDSSCSPRDAYRLFDLLSNLIYVFREQGEKMVLFVMISGASELPEQALVPHFSHQSVHSITSYR